MSDLNLPGEGDQATDGDLESTEERLAGDAGVDPPDDGPPSVSVPAPPD